MYKLHLLLVTIVLTSANTVIADDSLNSLWRDSFVPRYTEPPRSEIRKAKKLFRRHFSGEDISILQAEWSELGYDLMPWKTNDREFVLLRENENRREGRGFFVFSGDDVGSSLVIQAPHGKSDLHTGRLAAKLMTEHRIVAGAWNTAPRRYEENGIALNADMGKRSNSYFAAFTEALGAERKDITTLQLHGFSNQNRMTESGANADAIVSPGVKQSKSHTDAYHVCLRRQLGKNVLLFPRDVNELGGTLNISGEILRQYHSLGFIHLELSKGLRDELRRKRKLRSHLVNCLE